MNIYYQDDNVVLYHGSCLDDNEWTFADVLVTDPPYGMGYVSKQRVTGWGGNDPIIGDEDTVLRDTALLMWPPYKPGMVFGTWRCPPPKDETHRMIWFKAAAGPGMGDTNFPFGTCHEDIHIIGPRSAWNREEIGIKRTGSVIVTHHNPGGTSGPASRYKHPTPKPLDLMEQLLQMCPKGVIADPFAGSGSTLVAARNMGRKAIGVEVHEPYCEMIARRLSQDVLVFGDGDDDIEGAAV